MSLSNTQRVEILKSLGCGDKTRTQKQVCEIFNTTYPDRRISQSTVSRIENKFQLRMLFPDDDKPNEIDRNIWFQQDRATPYFSLEMPNTFCWPELDEENLEYKKRRIYNRTDAPPIQKFKSAVARSPDLSLLDFFLWGFLKEIVYRQPIHNTDLLKTRIIQSSKYLILTTISTSIRRHPKLPFDPPQIPVLHDQKLVLEQCLNEEEVHMLVPQTQ
ncbi:hypothetical protein NQ318_006912 [Aromia moschata]|uniref:Uncharacterized protein n=1 Tax=Aromia moschata TaxID=1265417 RepID=A0AAV8YP81_9CUCU|nr:hypothetical protein NQ318_006912 [Aromia moschata]